MCATFGVVAIRAAGRLAISLALPVLQLGAAGLSLALWLLLAHVASPVAQVVPVRSFAIGAVLGLVISLGLPYLLANQYRDVDPSRWQGRGPWSPIYTIGLTCCLVA